DRGRQAPARNHPPGLHAADGGVRGRRAVAGASRRLPPRRRRPRPLRARHDERERAADRPPAGNRDRDDRRRRRGPRAGHRRGGRPRHRGLDRPRPGRPAPRRRRPGPHRPLLPPAQPGGGRGPLPGRPRGRRPADPRLRHPGRRADQDRARDRPRDGAGGADRRPQRQQRRRDRLSLPPDRRPPSPGLCHLHRCRTSRRRRPRRRRARLGARPRQRRPPRLRPPLRRGLRRRPDHGPERAGAPGPPLRHHPPRRPRPVRSDRGLPRRFQVGPHAPGRARHQRRRPAPDPLRRGGGRSGAGNLGRGRAASVVPTLPAGPRDPSVAPV
ncbi:MAG: 4-hydroxy-tetrahydrodipicolinate synthase, partial [uncultured Thermomicrobiales bacterium]